MRGIVFNIDSSYPERTGGRETWLFNVSQLSLKKGYPIYIICRNGSKNAKLNTGIKYYRFISGNYLYSIPKILKPFVYLSDKILFVLYSISALLYLRIICKQNDLVVVGMHAGFESFPGLFGKAFLGIPFICSVRGIWHYEIMLMISKYVRNKLLSNSLYRLFLGLELFTLKRATIITANGYDTEKRLRQMVSNRIEFLPNGVDLERFQQLNGNLKIDNEFIIASIAYLRDIKGIPQGIKSIPYILKRGYNNFIFKFIGGGNPKNYIELAEKLGVCSYVEFPGESWEIEHTLPEISIILCLSGGSGISHSLLEAMAAGKAIIAWNTPVYSQILTSGKNAILIEQDNAVQLAESIIHLMDNPEEIEELGKNARKVAENFGWPNVVERFEQILQLL